MADADEDEWNDDDSTDDDHDDFLVDLTAMVFFMICDALYESSQLVADIV